MTIVTFLLTEGARRSTVAAVDRDVRRARARRPSSRSSSTSSPASPTLRGSEDVTYLQAVGLSDIDIGGLILAAIIFGALGILDDVTVTQAATVAELHEADPRARAGRAR